MVILEIVLPVPETDENALATIDGLSREVILTEGDITTVEVVSKAVEKAFLKVAVLVEALYEIIFSICPAPVPAET